MLYWSVATIPEHIVRFFLFSMKKKLNKCFVQCNIIFAHTVISYLTDIFNKVKLSTFVFFISLCTSVFFFFSAFFFFCFSLLLLDFCLVHFYCFLSRVIFFFIIRSFKNHLHWTVMIINLIIFNTIIIIIIIVIGCDCY